MYIYPEQDRQLESRMREIRTSGSEGGGGREASPYPYLSRQGVRASRPNGLRNMEHSGVRAGRGSL